MNTMLGIGRLCGLLALVGSVSAAAGQAPEAAGLSQPVTVELISGRSFTASVDARTDDAQLWLRWGVDSARLLRPIQWDRIREARVGQQTLTGAEFRRLVEASRPAVIPLPPEVLPGRIVSKGEGYPAGEAAGETPSAERARPAPDGRRVQSLTIDVGLARWDADAEVDGLVVDICPLDATGRVVPVDGTLEVELIVQRWGVIKHPQPFAQRGRWIKRVRSEDFGPSGARYRLSFDAVGLHPEFESKLGPFGAVCAELSVPGQGVFAATDSLVRIRPYSAVRDALERATGRRFFPREKTGGGG